VEAFSSWVVMAHASLVAQQNTNAEKTGKGFAQVVDGISGALTDLTGDPQTASILGWVLLIAAALFALRLLGIMRR
jgi:hypothetical protein